MSAYNLMGTHKTGGYLVTGAWAKKAAKEASFMGNSLIVGSSEDKNFNYIPKIMKLGSHGLLSCNVQQHIFGTQIKDFYKEYPLACDMSSDIFSRKIDVKISI